MMRKFRMRQMDFRETLRFWRIRDCIRDGICGSVVRAAALGAIVLSFALGAAFFAWMFSGDVKSERLAVLIMRCGGVLALFAVFNSVCMSVFCDPEDFALCVARFALFGGRFPLKERHALAYWDIPCYDDAKKSGTDGEQHGQGRSGDESCGPVQIVASGDGDPVDDDARVEFPVTGYFRDDEAAGRELEGRLVMFAGRGKLRLGFRRLAENGFVLFVHAAHSTAANGARQGAAEP